MKSPADRLPVKPELICRRPPRSAISCLRRLRHRSSLSWRRLVLRRALRLHLFGHEAIIWAQFAFNQGLRPVFERIRKRIATDVGHRQVPALLGENEIDATRNMG